MRDSIFIETVSPGFLNCFSLDGGKTECRGYFLCRLEEERWAAVDNSAGLRRREEFRTMRTACLWLNGHLVLNIDNVLCDGTTRERIPDVAERVRAEIEREQLRKQSKANRRSL